MEVSIIFVVGVSGSGKTTVGKKLAAVLNIPFHDADDFHSQANRDKMAAGHPLNDDDRMPWLITLNELARNCSREQGCVIACSALKTQYRQVLASGIDAPVRWVLLTGDVELLSQRLVKRKDHFMPASLLQSQIDILEKPADAVVPDISQSPEDIVAEILRNWQRGTG